jgi:tetratricopeptide (TPR) repeat protein
MVQWMRKASWPEARNALERAKSRLGERGSHDIRGRLDRGARDLELADRLDANLRLGMLLLEVGGPAEAVGYYKTALAIRPGMALAHNNLGSALTRTNRSGEAIESD